MTSPWRALSWRRRVWMIVAGLAAIMALALVQILPISGSNRAILTIALAAVGIAAQLRVLFGESGVAAALGESEARYRLLADNATDLIVRRDLEGRRLYVSPSAKELLGYEPEELMGLSIVDLVHPDDLPRVQQEMTALLAGEDRPVMTYRARHRDGHYVWSELSQRLVRDPVTGAPIEVITVGRDITERKGFEEQLAHAKEVAETANLAKSEFLARMTHELRTPLNAIMGFSEMMARELFGPIGNARYRDYLDDIQRSARHLLELISEVLDYAQTEAGRLELAESEAVDVGAVIEFARHILQPRADAAQVDLRVELVASTLRADERRLRQILLNLMSNAIKYTPAGGSVVVRVAREAGGDLMVAVEDTGIGMRPEDLGQALLPFRRIAAGARLAQEGTGLGLPLAKRLIELHGGTLELRSAVGVGTSAIMRLPAGRVASPRGVVEALER